MVGTSSRFVFAWLIVVAALMLSGVAAVFLFVPHYRQWEARGFERVPGKIINISKTVRPRNRPLETLDLRYEYFVSGHRYENDTSRYDMFLRYAAFEKSIAKRYAVGTDVVVFTRPDVPTDALLEPGVDWAKLQMEVLVWLCLPGLSIAVLGVELESSARPAVFLQPIATGNVVTVHDRSSWFPMVMTGVSFAVVAVVGCVVIGLTWSSAPWFALPVWAAVLILPISVLRTMRKAWGEGTYDLTIDFDKGIVTLPGGLLTQRDTFNIAAIEAVVLRPPRHRDGVNWFQVAILTKFEHTVFRIPDAADAQTFATWLANQLCVPWRESDN